MLELFLYAVICKCVKNEQKSQDKQQIFQLLKEMLFVFEMAEPYAEASNCMRIIKYVAVAAAI